MLGFRADDYTRIELRTSFAGSITPMHNGSGVDCISSFGLKREMKQLDF